MNLFRNIDHPYIIAEIGANHNGDLDLAYTMIDKAKECGADAVKFQHFDRYNFCTQKSLDDLDQGIVKLENVPSFDIPELSTQYQRSNGCFFIYQGSNDRCSKIYQK